MKSIYENDWFYKIFNTLIKTLSSHIKKSRSWLKVLFFKHSFHVNHFESILSKFIFDFSNDTDIFDLKVRESSSNSLKQSFQSSSISISMSLSRHVRKNIKMISLFEITRLKDSFEYQIWRREMKDQLIFMNLWHYVEIENVEQFELIDSITIVSISIIFEKISQN